MGGSIMARGLTRRQFLKTTAAMAAVAAASDQLSSGRVGSLVRSTEAAANPNVQVKTNFCSGCHQPTCATLVTVSNGVAVGIMGDPANPRAHP